MRPSDARAKEKIRAVGRGGRRGGKAGGVGTEGTANENEVLKSQQFQGTGTWWGTFSLDHVSMRSLLPATKYPKRMTNPAIRVESQKRKIQISKVNGLRDGFWLFQIDPREQLRNVQKLKVYKYAYNKGFAEQAGLSEDEREDTGVLAQEVKQVLPDAVKETGDVILSDGEKIENFLVVNKVRFRPF